ncbi:SDR family oxidoreductase [Parafrankia discariae]|uniref:SDR family oxidoreductase n=1 Tax=Parafrankia discariae TaxID=365528 RepID=UPI000374A1D0|nr:SDR family oxidoreductase [Parafrankia discariae]
MGTVERRLTLTGRSAVVTGGSRGIGRAIVLRLARDGADVVFSFRDDGVSAADVAAEAKNLGVRAVAVRADQGNLDHLRRLFDEADRHLDALDILVVNAAINPPTPIAEVTEADYDRVMSVNAKGTFFALQLAAARLRDGGRVITVSTLNTAVPAPGLALYAGSKGAVEQITAVASRELGPRGITVNCVSPGATDTDLLRATNPPEALERTASLTALGRLGQPADIANVVAFLAGPDSQWITGQNLRATGGLLV